MPTIHQWIEIEDDFKHGAVILGNGASIALSSSFSYNSLFEEAVERGHINDQVQEVFDRFNVTDFELVLRRLWQAKQVNEALSIEHGLVEKSYRQVRDALIKTIRETHITYQNAESHLDPIANFLKQFKTVISLNYDLIVYWARMHGNRTLGNWFKDCFVNGVFRNDWETLKEPWKARDSTLVFYPHGNLALRHHGFSGTRKIKADEDADLLDSILNSWITKSLAPVFVCEGIEQLKRSSIASCDYLEKIFYEVLPSLNTNIVIYGWGLADQDNHLIEQIAKANPARVAISVYGDDQTFIGKVQEKLNSYDITDVIFFDSQSPGAWNTPIEPEKESNSVLDVIPHGEKIVGIRKVLKPFE